MSANIESYDQVKNLIAGYQQMSQETGGVPIFVGVDEEGGIAGDRTDWRQPESV